MAFRKPLVAVHKPLRLADLVPPSPPAWLSLSPDLWVIRKLSIPDIIMYDSQGRVVFVWEVCKRVLSLALHFSLYYIFIQLKMYEQNLEAEEKLNTAVFGNWRKGVLAMGGATCVGGIVRMANTFPSLLVPYLPLTQFCRLHCLHISEDLTEYL